MALGNLAGIGYVVPDDVTHPTVTPEDTRGIAATVAARIREVKSRLSSRLDTLTARVDALVVASGQGAGSPGDGAVAGYILNAASQTSKALTTFLDRGPVHISRWKAVGDGSADDTAALEAAAQSGREVHFDTDATYNFRGPITLSAGTRWITYGAQLYLTAPRDGSNIRIESGVFIDRLDVSFAGGDKDRGVTIAGSDVEIGAMRLVARAPSMVRNYRRRALNIGVEGTGCQNVRLGHVRTEGWIDAVAIWDSWDVSVERLSMYGYVQGLLLRDSGRVTVHSGIAALPNEAMQTGNPGENGVLIESFGDSESEAITISNFTTYHAGEHGFRVGGQVPVENVHFENCRSRFSGSGKTVQHGGCGFKVLGATTNQSSVARHATVRFTNCIVEDVTPGMASHNFAGFNVGKCKDVVLDNCVVRTVTGSSSAAYGFALIGSENVSIVNATVEDTVGAAVKVYTEPTTAEYQWGTPPTHIKIVGGEFRRCSAGVLIEGGGQTVRRFTMSGVTIDGGAYAVSVANATLNRCHFDFLASGITTATLSGCETAMVSGRGDLVGASPARGGSTFHDYGAYQLKVYRSGGWTAI